MYYHIWYGFIIRLGHHSVVLHQMEAANVSRLQCLVGVVLHLLCFSFNHNSKQKQGFVFVAAAECVCAAQRATEREDTPSALRRSVVSAAAASQPADR